MNDVAQGRKRILVVEDSNIPANILARKLQQSYLNLDVKTVIGADNAENILIKHNAAPFDAVIIGDPDDKSITLIEELKVGVWGGKPIPTLFRNYDDSEFKEKALRSGATKVIDKNAKNEIALIRSFIQEQIPEGLERCPAPTVINNRGGQSKAAGV